MQRRLMIAMPAFLEQSMGGAELHAYTVAKHARRFGFEPHYTFVDLGHPYENALQLNLHPIKSLNLNKRLGPIWSLYSRKLWRILREVGPDVTYVRGGWSFAYIAALYARRYQKHSVWCVASDSDLKRELSRDVLLRPFQGVEKVAINKAIERTDRIFCQTLEQQQELKRSFGRNATIIPQMQPVPQLVGAYPKKPHVLWVGNIKPLKRPDLFLQLAEEFRDCSDVKFTMVGRPDSGIFQQQFELSLNETPNVRYMGEVSLQEANALIESSSVLVNTSDYEGFPNTFVQAWMHRRPVLSLNVDPGGVIEKYRLGSVSRTVEAMKQDLLKILEDKDEGRIMGLRARRYAEANHTEDAGLRAFFEALEVSLG